MVRSLYTLLLLSVVFTANAQTALEQAFEMLKKGSELPETLQSTRSAVFLNVAPSGSNTDTPEWMRLSEELHENLIPMYIDVVAYYRWQDINSGFDATASYMEAIRDREINQVILLRKQDNDVQLFIIPTTSEPGLLATDKPTWHATGSTLEEVIATLASTVRRTDLEVANYLIVESPEYFIDTEIFTKNRFESFQPDLKLDKLAVPLFFGQDPENIENPEDRLLESMISIEYPFSFELVGKGFTEDLMKKAGFQYVLRFLHGEESTLKTLLDYSEEAVNPTATTYKFYFKHLITGDVYLGDSWDGKADWQSALNEHLINMKKRLKVE